MKKLLLLMLLVVCAATVLSGCNGMVDSWEERNIRTQQGLDIMARQAVDDVDYLFLNDRSMRLTPWQVRVGY